jgi:hypothetical protein
MTFLVNYVSPNQLTAPEGCAVLSAEVFRTMKNGAISKTITVCGSAPFGPVKIDNAEFIAHGLTKLSVSFLSDLVLGKGTYMELYNGPKFDGPVITIRSTPTIQPFYTMRFRNGVTVNDNIYSAILYSNTPTLAECP